MISLEKEALLGGEPRQERFIGNFLNNYKSKKVFYCAVDKKRGSGEMNSRILICIK